jgi:hypothetical protein
MYAKAREKKQRFTHYVNTSIASFWRSEKDKQQRARSESKQARTPLSLSLSQRPDQKSRIEPSQRLFPSKRDKNEKKGYRQDAIREKISKREEKKKASAEKAHSIAPLYNSHSHLIPNVPFDSTRTTERRDQQFFK